MNVDWTSIMQDLGKAVRFGHTVGRVERDREARSLWCEVYPSLSEGKAGMFGAVTARSEAQAMRLACLYALLDCSEYIRLEHLEAGLEAWRYCEDSCKFLFGDALGDPTADSISNALRASPLGMTRNEIREIVFQRNKSAAEIARALNLLERTGQATFEREETGGRPLERWFSSSGTRYTRYTRKAGA